MNKDILDPTLRRAIRRAFDVRNQQVPILVGDKVELIGTKGGHFTRGGTRIYHPSSYARNGWGNMVYEPDSRIIHITLYWLQVFIRSSKPYTGGAKDLK